MLLSRVSLFIASLAGCLLALASYASPEAATARRDGLVRWAYFVPEDPASLASLRQRAGHLDYVGLHWATMKPDGSVDAKGNLEVIRLVRSLGARPILSITAGSAEAAHAFLATDDSRAVAVANLVSALADYDGVGVDFEGLYPEDRDALTRFMAQLATRLRPTGKLVSMALSAKTSDIWTGWAGSLDYAGLAPHADLFVLMAYGYRTARSTVPGSTAPMPWVESTLAYTLSRIPREKVLLGLPLYGYDWDTTAGPPARALRYPDAAAIAGEHGASIQHDPVQRSARFSYSRDGHSHEVWLEDLASFEPKLALARRQGVAGIAVWRLGHEDPRVWQSLLVATPTPSTPIAATPVPTVPVVATPTPGTPTFNRGQGGTTWYFAEGSTAAPFDSWILLQNPGATPATARITFMLEGGRTITHGMLVGATARASLFANQIVPSAAFSARIESDQPVFAERAMYAGFDGHVVTAVPNPSRLWYFAEGATAPPFHTWVLLQNPNSAATTATITYLKEDGTTTAQPLLLHPNSRTSVFANQALPNAAFSTRVESDLPIIAERAMYRFPGNAATGVTGSTAPSRSWYFAGALPTFRNVPVDTWLLLQNPNPFPVTATVTLLGTDGQIATRGLLLPPTSRQSLFASQGFSSASFGMQVEATGEIVAEKSVFIAATAFSGNEPQGAFATQGSPGLGTVWALPEGSTAPPFSEKIGVLNPHDAPMPVRFEFMLDTGRVVVHEVTVEPRRALDLELGGLVPPGAVSTRMVTGLPSVVERSMFWAKDGKTGVHNTVGIRME